MKKNLFIAGITATLALASCGNKTNNDQEALAEDSTSIVAPEEEIDHTAEHIAFLNDFYKDFFEQEADNWDTNAEKYLPHCSDEIIQELKDQYEYECENGECYAWWIFRGGAQDPGSGAITVTKAEDGWYEVNCDGWYGTIVKVRVEGAGDDLMITGVINPEGGNVQ